MDQAQAFAEARNRMVDSQVRPNKVTDPRIIAAMRRLPRERFLPPRLASLAYADEDVPLGEGRVLIEPAVIARLVQLAAIATGERALVVAAGTGYGAALLAACGARVTALEDSASLQAIARSVLAELAPSVSLVAGPLAAGWPVGAPYDVILIEGAVRDIPPAIGGQLHQETGRLVAVCSTDGRICQAMLAESTPAGLRLAPMFDCSVPPIPSLQRSPGFVF
jgi:protein-L-isoaspartate(D-aspartate) O-methyltransferase